MSGSGSTLEIDGSPESPRLRNAASPYRCVAHVGGELMMTAGAVVVLFIVYQLWVTGLFQARTQERLHNELARTWSAPTDPSADSPGLNAPAAGTGPPSSAELSGPLAVLRIPAFGAGYAPVVVEGVSTADLKLGPGHYPGTAFPGEIGNFVLSGHRTTYGAPFSRLDELKPGAPIVVEMKEVYFTYLVTGSEVVSPNQVDVIAPVPSQPDAAPTKALMTVVTCHPKFSAASRLIVFAELTATRPKSSGPPRELAEG